MSVDGRIGLDAVSLEKAPSDPADRIIVTTAVMHGGTLVTADEAILGWPGELRRQDARS